MSTLQPLPTRYNGAKFSLFVDGHSSNIVCFPIGNHSGLKYFPVKLQDVLSITLADDMSELVVSVATVPQSSPKSAYKLKTFTFIPEAEVSKESAQKWVTEVCAMAYSGVKPRCHFLIVINPQGGRKRAPLIWSENAKPVFESAKATFDVVDTNRRGHGVQIGQEITRQYDGIVCVSGDGVVHEIINGLLSRSDWYEVTNSLTVGVIPGGSGNALCVCLLGEERAFDPVLAALNILKGKRMTIDICSVTQKEGRYFSFLSQGFGLAAEVDIATEPLRWMGDFRFTYGALTRIIAKKKYKCQVAIRVAESDLETIKSTYTKNNNDMLRKTPTSAKSSTLDLDFGGLANPVPDDWLVFNDDLMLLVGSKLPWLSRGLMLHPFANPNDHCIDVTYLKAKDTTRAKGISLFLKAETGTHVDLPEVKYLKAKAFRVTPLDSSGYITVDGENVAFSPFQVEIHGSLIFIYSMAGRYWPTRPLRKEQTDVSQMVDNDQSENDPLNFQNPSSSS